MTYLRHRPVALCLSAAPICPKCERIYMRTQMTPDGRVLRCCDRKLRGKPCGGRAYIVGLDGELCVVIGISEPEWREITSNRAIPALRGMAVLVEAVGEAQARSS